MSGSIDRGKIFKLAERAGPLCELAHITAFFRRLRLGIPWSGGPDLARANSPERFLPARAVPQRLVP